MCEVITYIVSDMMIVTNLYLTWSQFYYYFYVQTESKTPHPLTSGTPLPESLSSSSSGSIVTPIPTVTQGKWAL